MRCSPSWTARGWRSGRSVGHALLLRDGRVQARGPVDEVLTGERMTACFGRPIEVSRHEGRWLARSGRR